MKNSKAIDEFYGKLKDPYYGRPLYLKPDAPVAAVFILTIEKTGEIVNFVKLASDQWAAYGNDRTLRGDYTTKEAETLVMDYVIVAERRNDFINVHDPCACLIIRSNERIDQYV